MAIRDDFEVVAGQVRVVLQRFALGLLVLAAFIAMLVGKADTVLVENARVLALDLASPALEAIARPVAAANRAIVDLKEFASLREENARLREENSRLLAWQTAARRLENENDRLRDLSQFREGPEASFITSRIVGDSVSAYVRGALLNVGRKAGVTTGQAVVTGEGLAGRVAEVGENSARVLFVTDVNSRLPVVVERTRERAILVGDNSPQLRLNLLQGVAGVQRGDRIVTSGDGGSFPVGIPIGEVVQTGEGHIRIRPFADFSRLEFVRVVNYGVTGLVIANPPAPPAVPAGQKVRFVLPGTVLLFFVVLTLAPLRVPYFSDALPLLPALVVFQFSLATPERLPGPMLLALGILLDLLLGGPGAPVGVSALGFVLIRSSVVANRRYLVGVPFLFQWIGFCLLAWGYVLIVWILTALWTWTAPDPVPAMMQYAVVIVIYPVLAPLLARVRARDPLNVPELSRGTARPGDTTA